MLTVDYQNGNVGQEALTFKVQTGMPVTGVATFSYTGPPVPIPDNTPGGISIPIVVSGLPGAIGDLNFRFDGTSCTDADGATTVGLDHPWVGDLVVTLTSPQGTTVKLLNHPGGGGNSGNNFRLTVLDDSATARIPGIPPSAPYTGAFKPDVPFALAAFIGENGNGTWTLNVTE